MTDRQRDVAVAAQTGQRHNRTERDSSPRLRGRRRPIRQDAGRTAALLARDERRKAIEEHRR